MKHTPGPWKAKLWDRSENPNQYGNTIHDSTDFEIASLSYTGGNEDQDAHLIAASPELKEEGHVLAVLVLQSDLYQSNYEIKQAVDNFLAVEAKVEGK